MSQPATLVENFIDVLNDNELDPHDKRTRLDGLKWFTEKFAPREYGDRPDSAKTASVTVVFGDLSAPPKTIEGETVKPKVNQLPSTQRNVCMRQ